MTELNDSILGTKEYWDSVYVKELENFVSCNDDVGEIWFGEVTERKIIHWIINNCSTESSIADIGTGNGHILSELYEDDYHNLTGIDYSESSLSLAASICKERNIRFVCHDFVGSKQYDGSFDICIDKGTYDAISLSTSSNTDRFKYKNAVKSILNPGGKFIIASVNWTVVELIEFFSDVFKVLKEIPSKKFTFGGQTGQDVSIVIFTIY